MKTWHFLLICFVVCVASVLGAVFKNKHDQQKFLETTTVVDKAQGIVTDFEFIKNQGVYFFKVDGITFTSETSVIFGTSITMRNGDAIKVVSIPSRNVEKFMLPTADSRSVLTGEHPLSVWVGILWLIAIIAATPPIAYVVQAMMVASIGAGASFNR